MAILGQTAYTIDEIAGRLEPDQKNIATAIEVLDRATPILQDIPWKEGNLLTGHQSLVRSALPTISYRRINEGAEYTKDATENIVDTAALLEVVSDVDEEIMRLNGWSAAFRASRDKAFIESMGQKVASDMFYGDTSTDPAAFNGLSVRRDTPSTDRENPGYYMLSGGGAASDNTSIWLVAWGDNLVNGIYPKGTVGGLEVKDIGEEEVTDSSSRPYTVMRTKFKWRPGLALQDYGAVVRICNIDVSNLTSDSSAADLIELMEKALYVLEERAKASGTVVFYANKTVSSSLARQTRNQTNMQLRWDKDKHGNPVMEFQGYQIRTMDNTILLNTEATVSGTFQSEI
jgi:hypothetical protein